MAERKRKEKRKREEEPEAEAAPRRSSRVKRVRVVARKSVLTGGFDDFGAGLSSETKGGGSTTAVVLRIGRRAFNGSSGAGHAEMNALNDALETLGSLGAIRAARSKTVACTAKPCCYRCSIVLGLLGFRAHSQHTKKTRSGMGSTQWVLPQPLKGALEDDYGDIQTLVAVAGNIDNL